MKKRIPTTLLTVIIVLNFTTGFTNTYEDGYQEYGNLRNSLSSKQLYSYEERSEKVLNSSDTHGVLDSIDIEEVKKSINIYPYVHKATSSTISSTIETPNIDTTTIVGKINKDVYDLTNKYMQATKYIPVKDPLWFMAIGMVEYNHAENHPDLLVAFPIKLEDYTETFIENYSYKYVVDNWGLDYATRRTGGAIGPYQLESFYASNVDGVIPEDLGKRTDIWLEYGSNPTPHYGTDISWAKGYEADRWSIADATNLSLDVYDTTLKRVNGKCALTELEDRYAQVTLLTWAHNRGTGILGNKEYARKASIIASHKDDIINLVKQVKPDRFTRSNNLMPLAREIADEAGSDLYPVMSLMSYIILELKVKGEI